MDYALIAVGKRSRNRVARLPESSPELACAYRSWMLYCTESTNRIVITAMSATLQPLPPAAPHKAVLDRVGATGSMLCAVHCALLPLILALAPAIGAGFANPVFEVGFIGFASVVGLTSLVLGYRLHRVGRALAFLVPGIGLLWGAVLVEPIHHNLIAHAIAMASGGSLIAIAHLLNLRFTHVHTASCGHLHAQADH